MSPRSSSSPWWFVIGDERQEPFHLTRLVSLSGLSGELTDYQPGSISVALLLAEANPRSVVTINMSSWLANST